MKKGKSTATTEEKHLLSCKNYEMVALYEKMKETVFKSFENIGTGATADYVSWNVGGKRQFANFYIQKKKIRVLTLAPKSEQAIGERVPDTHLWTLNYQMDISSNADIEKANGVLVESYRQIKSLI